MCKVRLFSGRERTHTQAARLQSPCFGPRTPVLQGLHQSVRPVLPPLFCVPGAVFSVALSLCPQRRRSEGIDSDSTLVIHTHKWSCETEKADNNYDAINYLASTSGNWKKRSKLNLNSRKKG